MEQIIANLLEDFEQGKMTRRQLIRGLAFTVTASVARTAAAADSPAAKATYINHVSVQVADYTKSRDFYASLFGMKVSNDDGQQCRLTFGDNILIVRNASSRPSGKLGVDHIAYTLANWDTDKKVKPAVETELKRRGIQQTRPAPDSFHIKDPDGFEVQIGGKNQ
jgi:catechol-2,3-dioxygenase